MNVVDALQSGSRGCAAPAPRPDQSRLQSEGDTYLMKDFPRMDYVKDETKLSARQGAPA